MKPFAAWRSLRKLTKLTGDPFRVTQFPKTHAAQAIKEAHAELAAGTKTEAHVAVAGRIMAIRNGGMFIVILDGHRPFADFP